MEGSVVRFVFLLSLAILGDHYYCKGASLDPFPMGTIGCLVSDVCDSREICANDLLFGSCQSVFSRALHGEPRFTLTHYEIRQLERQITALIKAGFTWKDAFTQCILQNTLMGFTRSGSESTGNLQLHRLCEDALGVAGAYSDETELEQEEEATEEAINSEIAAILLRLLASAEDLDSDPREKSRLLAIDSDNEDDPADEGEQRPSRLMQELLGSSQKRDEIVQVHKYFDKSKGTWKRDPYYSRYLEGKDPDTESSQYSLYYPGYSNGDDSNNAPQFLIKGSEDSYSYPAVANGDEPWGDDMGSPDPIELKDIIKGSPNEQDKPLLGPNIQTGNMNLEEIIGNLVLSEDDERTLQGLLEGSILPRDLDEAQQKRLQVFIESLIEVLETDNENMGEPELEEGTDPLIDDAAAAEGPLDAESMVGPSSDLDSEKDQGDVLPRELEDEALSKVETIPDEMVSTSFPESEASKTENAERVESDGTADDVEQVQVDKKMTVDGIDETEEATEKPYKGPFDPNTMFLQLSDKVNLETARQFVRNLTDVLKLPPGLIYEIRVDPDGAITLKLNPDPDGIWDTEKLAKDAKASNDKLKAMGGITVTSSGFGQYGNRVELKQNNRYVVLTFILVGTIAGVVLAVVTIYLIKRHSRSRHKLQQLASNPDGNEASKDYQDLCRQRMQGKTSEKPEPLHAASRIGSVSEAQVRSPSSRSSTSSWSEEPAATNMDISTGHIVLSYMEDHLKNQDRLDREWEAVSGYVADPCSTRMAQDQANVRKNRFADILPYDHSRVILSSNANVANSDYTNASFITDHDPRNPAYICTQGPLPHTVADFWQMIWEQGSVVIVMLTKLTESGTSLCHRYWPEEGSDLYHIYEVHLVSEHIWCDDYLVRSFYLKNLQTNETRTVTQFHFLTWPELSVPASIKATLDFRRKVNKSFRGRSCPIVVHCSDGCGRSGTYCLIDMVLNKMAKGAKEIDMAATLEHIRDQRMSMVKTKEQFQFSLAAVAEEVHAILKALPQ